jgi:hypothetical protein
MGIPVMCGWTGLGNTHKSQIPHAKGHDLDQIGT